MWSTTFGLGHPAIRSRAFGVAHPAIQSRAFGEGHPSIRSWAFGVGPTDGIQVQCKPLIEVRYLR